MTRGRDDPETHAWPALSSRCVVVSSLLRPWRGWTSALLLLAALVGLPAAAALRGARGPATLRLNLGPGDSHYVSGFAPEYEVNDGEGRHWSRGQAAVHLPLVVQGGPNVVRLRFGPPPMSRSDSAEVRLTLGRAAVDHFVVPGGGMQEHLSEVSLSGAVPLDLGIEVAWPGTDALGLWLDFIDFGVPSGGVTALSGGARWRAGVTVGIVFLALLATGCPRRRAVLLTGPLSLAAAVALLRDPWLVHGLLRGVPEALVLYAGGLSLVVLVLRRRHPESRGDIALVAALMLAGFVLRGLALNTPGYYYPDLRSHARLALAIREAGLAFAADPVTTVARVGLWQNPLGGRVVTFPYAPGFHLPLAASGLPFDDLLTAEKLLGAAASTLPIAFLFLLARKTGASPLGAALLLVAPIYGRHLAVAFLPALFGHAWDVGLIAWLQTRKERLTAVPVWIATAVLVCACQLAYVSAVTLIPALVLVLALLIAGGPWPRRWPLALALLGAGAFGSLLSVLAYYRHFLGPILEALPGLGRSPGRGEKLAGFLEVAVHTTGASFAPLLLALAFVGLVLLLRREASRPILAAWLLAYFLLLAGRTLAPNLFQFQHEALFVAPLVFLAAGETVTWLWVRGRWARGGAAALVLLLLGLGLREQGQALLDQLRHAR